MIKFFKNFEVSFAIILTASALLFIGVYNIQSDIDDIEARKNSGESTYVIFPENTQTTLAVTSNSSSVRSGTLSLADTITLPANPGPSNNGGSPNWAIFFDVIAGPSDIVVTHISTGSTAAANANFSVEVFTRTGTSLGGPVSSGPGSSTTGWTSIGSVPAVQGPATNGVSNVFNIPLIAVGANDTVGVALRFTGAGPRYTGTGTGGPYNVYSDANISLVTGDGRSAPFTPTGSFFAPRALTGVLRYFVGTATGISNVSTEIPEGFKLSQNFPNPFNPSTTIEFAIPVRSKVNLKVYNSGGKEVSELVNGEYSAGTYRVNWNAAGLASGVYFYSIQAANFLKTKKLLLVK